MYFELNLENDLLGTHNYSTKIDDQFAKYYPCLDLV